MAGQSNTSRYKDLDLDFLAHPVTGDVVQKSNKESIKQSVKNLIMMNRFDKPFQPQLSGNIRNLLFEPDTPLTKIEMRKSIFDVIKRHEPRVRLIDVRILHNVVQNSYGITIKYQIINSPQVEDLTLTMERLR
tara:strand:+ start:153 stop:551 length:399 start_codon:yes stop_codon:yes gene_type:complete